MPKFTVFTPTYNRAYLIGDLYSSLLLQNYNDFEWLIVDDGSSDHTGELIQSYITEGKIAIRYLYKNNGGKHTAINLGLQQAEGELFFIVDSDDVLTEDALQTLHIKQQHLSASVAGLVGMKGYKQSGKAMTRSFDKNELIASSVEFTYQYGFMEETAICVKTNIAKEYPFPEFDGEKFCPESLLWNRISRQYQFYYFDTVIYLGDYLEGGLTDNYADNFKKSYHTSAICLNELFKHQLIPDPIKLQAAKTIVSLSGNSPHRISFILKYVLFNYLLKVLKSRF